jgi:ribonucleotide reductase beta subunit family protein with ferritin-like domain
MENKFSKRERTSSESSERDYTDLAFFPIRNPKLEEFYQEQKNVFWTAQEIDFSNDRTFWDHLDPNTKKYVKFLLFLFAQLDGIVSENLGENFKRETGKFAKECSMFYSIQEAIEWGHNETYSLLIKAFIRDPEEQKRGLNSIQHFPSIKKIADWAFSYMNPDIPLLERVVAFTCIEGVIFSSAFAGIYFLKRRNILPSLCKANEWIARDEAIHTRFGVALYHHITNIWKKSDRLTEEKVHQIIKSAVSVTENFTRNAMECDLVGIDADDMMSYVQATADRLSESLGYSPIYKVKNRLDWMVLISLPNFSNFFETRVTEYAREGGDGKFIFDLNAAF